MASPYYTKQPVYIEDPSRRFDNILPNRESSSTSSEYSEGPRSSYAIEMKNQKTRLNFPFTPTISVIQSANYSNYDLTHSNFQQRAFDSHTNMELNITAPMIVRSEEEALYVYNAAVWIRSTMKMQWAKDEEVGEIPSRWNWLEGWNEKPEIGYPGCVHYTRGGPWFKNWQDVDYADEWRAEEAAYLAK